MPEISRFLGIVIGMYYREHAPPHFHAIYGSYEVTVGIESGVVRGEFPSRALRHILEWSAQHKGELMDNWKKARKFEPLSPVEPLE